MDVDVKEPVERNFSQDGGQGPVHFMREIFYAMKDGFTIVDPNGVHLEVNPAFCTMTGYSREELLNTGLPHLYWPEEEYGRIQAAFKEMLQGECRDHELLFKRKNGERFPVLLSPSRLVNEAGMILYYFATVKDLTERRRRDKALKESEHRYRCIFENSPIAIGIGEMHSGRLIDVNEAWLTLFGYRREEVLDHTTQELSLYLRKEDREEIVQIIGERGRIVNHPIRMQQRCGKVINILYSAEVITLDSRKYLQVMLTNVTEQRQAEAALKLSEERYRIFASLASDYFYLCERRGAEPFLVKWLAGAVEAITGYSSEEFFEKGCWLPFVVEEDFERVSRHLFSFAPGDVMSESFRIRTKGGEIRWMLETSRCEKGVEPGELILYGTFKDVTEQKLVENRLKASEERFRSIMSLSPDIISILDDKGGLIYNSPAAKKVHGYEDADLVGLNTFELIHPDDQPKVAALFAALLAHPAEPVTVQYRYRNKDGSYSFMEANASNQLENPLVNGVVTISRNIADRKRLEEQRLDLERKFLHAQKLESLGTMASGIAHDFNNLLAVILGNLDLALLRLPPGSPVEKNVAASMQAGRRAADLTRQMLAYSGKAVFEVAPIDLNEIVRDNRDLFRTIIPKNISFEVHTEESLPAILGDPGQVQQVVMNLITNAAESIDSGQGVVVLTTGLIECDRAALQQSVLVEKPPPGKFVFIEVTDNGCGMGPETRQRLFEPFFTTKFTGRGLGMATTQGIVQSHRGAILLRTGEGEGTTFRILFPSAGPQKEGASLDDAQVLGKIGQGTQHKGTVLFVDDEESVRALGVELLQLLGFEALPAGNGIEALDIFRDQGERIDLVILDLTMPQMDGVATFSALKKMREEVPIILISGFSEHSVTGLFPDNHPEEYLQKPFQVSELKEKLASALKGATDRSKKIPS